MDEDKTGGPAFPQHDFKISHSSYQPILIGGMTLHDYYVGQAIVGLLAAGKEPNPTTANTIADTLLYMRAQRREDQEGGV